eukprot:GHVL01007824.1.p1 GENE.GHVL01007824.1~~GHVL01007824.1.p1  ORF type:complete len:240 (+),score=42.91 GHVL01007824.1:1417-2136(+)
MAHLGCYVPAEFACFRPINRIYTRFRTSDSIEEGASTFFIEMREMAQIEQGASMGSLVLVDELGRGTSITDGVAIAWAFCEHIINTSALTLFTTHYHQLTQLARVYPTCKNLSLFCEVYCPPPGVSGPGGLQSITNEYLRPSHEVCRGPSQLTKGYGITMASMAGFPDEIIQDSKTIYEKLSEKITQDTLVETPQLQQEKGIYAVAELLLAALNSSLEKEDLKRYLQERRDALFCNEQQ